MFGATDRHSPIRTAAAKPAALTVTVHDFKWVLKTVLLVPEPRETQALQRRVADLYETRPEHVEVVQFPAPPLQVPPRYSSEGVPLISVCIWVPVKGACAPLCACRVRGRIRSFVLLRASLHLVRS